MILQEKQKNRKAEPRPGSLVAITSFVPRPVLAPPWCCWLNKMTWAQFPGLQGQGNSRLATHVWKDEKLIHIGEPPAEAASIVPVSYSLLKTSQQKQAAQTPVQASTTKPNNKLVMHLECLLLRIRISACRFKKLYSLPRSLVPYSFHSFYKGRLKRVGVFS